MSFVTAIGLMSGTSMDGVDVALIETDGEARVIQGPSAFVPYGADDRARLRAAIHAAQDLRDRRARPPAVADCERLVTDRHAEAVERFLAAHAIERSRIAVVGFHGQTVLHRPEQALTIQIGDGQALADRLGLRVVHDFRARDMTMGGEGAPLAPVYHRALAAALGPIAVLNIGGVANVTLVDGEAPPIACDTGPGNALIDDLMLERTGAPLDCDGAAALSGRVDDAALAALMAHPFFQRPAPKSLDRNAFSRAPVAGLSTRDAAATLAAFTAESVAQTLKASGYAARAIIVCGGGGRNAAIMAELARRTGAPVSRAQDHGWSDDAMEAQAFAYMAVRALHGAPISFPTTTGAARPTPGGVLAEPGFSR